MNRNFSYLQSAKNILAAYTGHKPFSSFLKKYFAQHKKYGSKDRKQISHLCYCFFRLGKALQNLEVEERILSGLFLCSSEANEMLQQVKPDWNMKVKCSLEEKYSILNFQSSIFNVFPWKDELSNGIDHEKFSKSFFVQPDLFLRLRPGNENKVKKKLSEAGIQFEEINPSCLSLPNTSKLEGILALDKEAVIQDYSSQRTEEFLQSSIFNSKYPISVWDCCAGSGGKSIMLYDFDLEIKLTVSDIRESVLANLKKRFQNVGIKNYKSFVANLTQDSRLKTPDFDLIIADVPCTGSGTWSRTPEQLYFFDEQTIERYSNLQKKIVSNVIPYLKPGEFLLYITCSVFKKENEEVVDFIRQKFNLQLEEMQVLKGYDKKADTMFAALLRKTL